MLPQTWVTQDSGTEDAINHWMVGVVHLSIAQSLTRGMYWRLASIQDGESPGDAAVLKRVFRDNFVIFRHRSKRITKCICGISELFYVWLYANFQFPWWSRDHFLAPFWGRYLPNAWSQSLHTSKRHTLRVSAFHQYHWFGVKLFPIGCAHCAA